MCRSVQLSGRQGWIPLSLICRRWAAPASLGTETLELVDGGSEPEKEVVEGALGLSSGVTSPGLTILRTELREGCIESSPNLRGSRTKLVTWENMCL